MQITGEEAHFKCGNHPKATSSSHSFSLLLPLFLPNVCMSFFKTDFSIVFVTTLKPDPDKELCGGKTSLLLTDAEARGQFINEHALILRRVYNLYL